MKLQEVANDPKWYSNPCNMGSLPFPLLYSRLPTDWFHLVELTFMYMGWTRFSEIWNEVQSLKLRDGISQLYLHGTMGYGKSHLVAALVCLLCHLGKCILYLPDCRQMLATPFLYMKSTLLCAFSDPSSSSLHNEIQYLGDSTDPNNHLKLAKQFCSENPGKALYFIVDQMNVLEHELINTDKSMNSMKDR